MTKYDLLRMFGIPIFQLYPLNMITYITGINSSDLKALIVEKKINAVWYKGTYYIPIDDLIFLIGG